MFSRACSVCGWWADGKVVEIFEGVGVRRAKVIADGELVEIAPLGDGELHLGDRVDLAWPRPAATGGPREPIDCSELVDADDHDPFSKW